MAIRLDDSGVLFCGEFASRRIIFSLLFSASVFFSSFLVVYQALVQSRLCLWFHLPCSHLSSQCSPQSWNALVLEQETQISPGASSSSSSSGVIKHGSIDPNENSQGANKRRVKVVATRDLVGRSEKKKCLCPLHFARTSFVRSAVSRLKISGAALAG